MENQNETLELKMEVEFEDGTVVARPPRINVNPQGLFFRATEFERRVMGMLIAEIGEDRYKQLIKIAANDVGSPVGYAPQKSIYYKGPDEDMVKYLPQKIKEIIEVIHTRHEHMRPNKKETENNGAVGIQ